MKPENVLAIGPGVSVRVDEVYGLETQMECLVLVVADYFTQRIPKDKQAEILGSLFKQK